MDMCGTLKCENASICEKAAKCEEMSMLNVKIDARICEKNTFRVIFHIWRQFSHLALIIYSHLVTFPQIETFSHLRVPHHVVGSPPAYVIHVLFLTTGWPTLAQVTHVSTKVLCQWHNRVLLIQWSLKNARMFHNN